MKFLVFLYFIEIIISSQDNLFYHIDENMDVTINFELQNLIQSDFVTKQINCILKCNKNDTCLTAIFSSNRNVTNNCRLFKTVPSGSSMSSKIQTNVFSKLKKTTKKKIYILYNGKFDWSGAKSACEQMGLSLPVLSNEEDYYEFRTYAMSIEYTGWVGLSLQSNTFTWIDGSILVPNNLTWRTGAVLTYNCVHFHLGGLCSQPCTSQYNQYLCETS